MNTLIIATRDNQTAYDPGEELAGDVEWTLEKRPSTVELRLFWYTRGKGTTDAGIIDTRSFDRPPERDRRGFRFRFPDAPHSFSGKLISLVWALELVVLPGNHTQRLDLVMAPDRREIVLPQPS
jgi:hypothetical protein